MLRARYEAFYNSKNYKKVHFEYIITYLQSIHNSQILSFYNIISDDALLHEGSELNIKTKFVQVERLLQRLPP